MRNEQMKQEVDFSFRFRFNIHKASIPLGISDSDYQRLADVYGVPLEQLVAETEKISENNEAAAQKLLQMQNEKNLPSCAVSSIVFLGDSNTSNRKSYMNIIKLALQKQSDTQIVDLSVSGSVSGNLPLLPILRSNEFHPVAHIMTGANDLTRTDDVHQIVRLGHDEFKKNVGYVVEKMTALGTKVIVSSIPPRSYKKICNQPEGWRPIWSEDDRRRYNNTLKELAQKYNAIFNDMEPTYNLYTTEEITEEDGIHLNELGQFILAKRVFEILLNV